MWNMLDRIKFYCIGLILIVLFWSPGVFAKPMQKVSGQIASVDQKINSRESDRKIKEAFEKGFSDLWVQSQGVVTKVMKDDTDGARHQRFLLKLSNGHSILIAHNIDLADRIEGLKPGDVVSFYGEYEWNNKGGVVHWTHRDPSGRKTGGWLMHNGKRYE